MNAVTLMILGQMLAAWVIVGLAYLLLRRERARDQKNTRS